MIAGGRVLTVAFIRGEGTTELISRDLDLAFRLPSPASPVNACQKRRNPDPQNSLLKMGYHPIILGVKPMFKGILRVQEEMPASSGVGIERLLQRLLCKKVLDFLWVQFGKSHCFNQQVKVSRSNPIRRPFGGSTNCSRPNGNCVCVF